MYSSNQGVVVVSLRNTLSGCLSPIARACCAFSQSVTIDFHATHRGRIAFQVHERSPGSQSGLRGRTRQRLVSRRHLESLNQKQGNNLQRDYPYPDLKGLESTDRERYLDLALFPEDQPVPESALSVLWEATRKGSFMLNA
jgi:hypothetical protein